MADPYANINGLTDQGRTLTLITPNDSSDLPDIYKALLIGGTGGNISVDPVSGSVTAAVFPVVAGQLWDAVRVKRVRSTGTTATPIYGVS